MSDEFQKSLIQRTGIALAAVILLAIVNMVASYLTAESSENDAVRINLAGSLRMLTYRIANAYILEQTGSQLGNRTAMLSAVDEFEERLEMPVLAGHINSDNRVLGDTFSQVEAGWTRLKPQLLASDSVPQHILEQIDRLWPISTTW